MKTIARTTIQKAYERITKLPDQKAVPRSPWLMGTQDPIGRIGVYVAVRRWSFGVGCSQVLDWLTPAGCGLVVLACRQMGGQKRAMEVMNDSRNAHPKES